MRKQIVLEKLDKHMQKKEKKKEKENELRPLSHTTHKNELKMKHRPKYKS